MEITELLKTDKRLKWLYAWMTTRKDKGYIMGVGKPCVDWHAEVIQAYKEFVKRNPETTKRALIAHLNKKHKELLEKHFTKCTKAQLRALAMQLLTLSNRVSMANGY